MRQRWKARWVENGLEREFIFDSLSNLMVARIDFRLKFPYSLFEGKIPDRFELEEVNHAGEQCTPLIRRV